ncbi:MAG: EcsC family protein [Bacteroidales bacterium]|nr:EcsC family protein [Clostridium sp.]MCM1203256.1 EcsC family protein [Bacteroidales bacterium]
MSRFSWENEWRLQELKEESFVVKHVMDKTPKWVQLVERKVPETLQNTLEAAFSKAFIAVFEKGAGVIEKTYNKEKHAARFRQNKREMDSGGFNKGNMKKFERHARRTVGKNLAISSVEGVGFGIVGLGIPDIPIFVSVLLKSIYEIALSYGFSYTTGKEKLFILKMIDAALQSGSDLKKRNDEVNKLITRYDNEEKAPEQEGVTDEFVTELQITRQIDRSAKALSHELLYGKFVQGMTFVGVVGGTADFTCLKRITDYAALKYKRRFLLQQFPEE